MILSHQIAKSEVVHYNSHGFNVPAFSVGSAPHANKDSFRYSGMVFFRTHSTLPNLLNICLVHAGCQIIRHFAREHHLMDKPHTLLWLA